jgi:hypothetical protein
MTTTQGVPVQGPIARYEQSVVDFLADFQDFRQEWRRVFAEVLGTFFLVLVAAGGGMMGHAFPDTITRTDAVVAPALMVMGVILFMGKVSGAHLNPAVSIAFALRRDFQWRRVPGYIVAQLAGATLAALFLHAVIDVSATYGSNYPAASYSAGAAFWMELTLTMRLVSVISARRPGRRTSACSERWASERLHRPGRTVGQPDLRRVDEPGPHLRPRPRRRELHPLPRLRRRPDHRSDRRCRHRLRPARPRRRRIRIRGSTGRPVHRDPRPRQPLSTRHRSATDRSRAT